MLNTLAEEMTGNTPRRGIEFSVQTLHLKKNPAGCGSALFHQFLSSTKLSDMSAFICSFWLNTSISSSILIEY